MSERRESEACEVGTKLLCRPVSVKKGDAALGC